MASQQPLDAFSRAGDEEDDTGFEWADGVYRSEPAGVPCRRCGDEVTILWRDGIITVCPDCKDW